MITNYLEYRQFLCDELVLRIKRNPKYSQRAFARDLGLAYGEISEVLNNKRKLSLKSAIKISNSLGLNSEERNYLLTLVNSEKAPDFKIKSEPKIDKKSKTLSNDVFHLIADWYCFAILNLIDCKGFSWNISWISKKLGITKIEVKNAIQRMIRTGIIIKKKNKYEVPQDFILSPDEVPSDAVRKYHTEILKKAQVALYTQKIEERGFYGTGFAVDPKMVSEIKNDISRFQDHLVEKYNRGCKSEVYQLEIGFFKLTTGSHL